VVIFFFLFWFVFSSSLRCESKCHITFLARVSFVDIKAELMKIRYLKNYIYIYGLYMFRSNVNLAVFMHSRASMPACNPTEGACDAFVDLRGCLVCKFFWIWLL
jgi:hypothetical protein